MRIRISLLFLASLTVWALDFAAAQNKPNARPSTILGLENKWNAAYQRGDIAVMNSLLDDDFIITVEDGSTFSKPGYIAHSGDTTVHVSQSEMSDLKVRMHDNTAVVTGSDTEKSTYKGKDSSGKYVWTDVWVMRDGRWQAVASQSVKVGK